MADRDKVIKGLGEALEVIGNHVPERFVGYSAGAILDAIELLKAQEPRVLKPNEICNFTFDSAWVELKHNKDLTLVEWDKPTRLTLLWTVGSWDSYGKLWRCWTSRPTDEQREATPWD